VKVSGLALPPPHPHLVYKYWSAVSIPTHNSDTAPGNLTQMYIFLLIEMPNTTSINFTDILIMGLITSAVGKAKN
jgi:hypothetical protein